MKNIIITGGGTHNKGAESMSFIAITELKKRYPNHKIFLQSEFDMKRPKQELEIYNFEIIGRHLLKYANYKSNIILRILYTIKGINKAKLNETYQIYKNTDYMIDISGYALGSNWGVDATEYYLSNLIFAKAFDIKFFAMPQSFGPFDYEGRKGKKVEKKLKKLLSYASCIYARENDGYDGLVNKYGLANVVKANDLVLASKGYNLESVFKKGMEMNVPVICENSIGIVPNMQNIKYGDVNSIHNLYKIMIEAVLKLGKKVYIIAHSTADVDICRDIKEVFSTSENVVLIEDELNCIEFNEVVKKFDYLIASRYHSIVHAFKNGIPCLALGWAIKYQTLMSLFSQDELIFDVRETLDTEAILEALSELNETFKDRSATISNKIEDVQKINVFDVLGKVEQRT